MNDILKINIAKSVFRDAFNNGDVEQMISLFTPWGFTDMSDGGPSKFGEEAVSNYRARMSKLFAEYSVKFTPIVIDVVVLAGTAYDFGWHEFMLTPKNGGERIRKRQRYFELWNQMESGEWKISFHMNNEDVREELNGLTSSWFRSEERAAALSQ